MRPAFNACRFPMVTIAGLLLALYLVFWSQIHSGFSQLMGDPYDGLIENTLVNHWFWVMSLNRPWNEVGYFYPYADTLGYNDGYFIYGVIAAGFRLLGLNPFVAGEAAHILIKAIGFLGYLSLSQRVGNHRWASIIGALLFSIAINSTNHGHAQLLLVGLCPGLWLLGLIALERIKEGRSVGPLAAGAILLGAMLITGFYITYFACLFLSSLLMLGLILNPDQGLRFWRSSQSKLLLLVLILVVAITPFLCVYLPKLHETGGHNASAVFAYLLAAPEVVNDSQNLLWGDRIHALFSRWGITQRDGEYSVGFPPLFLLAFGFSGIFCIQRGVQANHQAARFFLIVTLSTLFWLLACIEWNGWSLWHLIYWTVPGAKGLRVVSRFYIFLTLPMTLIISHGVSQILGQASFHRISQAALALGCLLLIAEEINPHPYVAFSTAEPLAVLNRLTPPPASCRTFFAIQPKGFQSGNPEHDDVLRTNVQAMMISSFLNLPTVIGTSSFNPPDWNFRQNPPNTFESRVMAYAYEHHVLEDLCRLDISENQWTKVSYEENRPMTEQVFDVSHPSDLFLMSGFNGPENWGAWSSVDEPRILFKHRLPHPMTLRLKGIKGFGPMAHEFLEVSCGNETHQVKLSSEPQEILISFLAENCAHTLEFRGIKTTKPSNLPQSNSTDHREIGFGISQIAIESPTGP